MPQNGETNQKSGLYKSVCCGAEIIINAGSAFPDCPNHRKLTTIWKPLTSKAIGRTPKKTTSEPIAETHVEAHIENRRLFKVAAGQIKLEEWEQEHLHECKVCKGVLYVFFNQPLGGPSEGLPKPDEAA